MPLSDPGKATGAVRCGEAWQTPAAPVTPARNGHDPAALLRELIVNRLPAPQFGNGPSFRA